MAVEFDPREVERWISKSESPATRNALESELREYQTQQREANTAIRNAATTGDPNKRRRYETEAKTAERKAQAAIRQMETEIRRAERLEALAAEREARQAEQEAEREERAFQRQLEQEERQYGRLTPEERKYKAQQEALDRAADRKRQQQREQAAAARRKAIRSAGKQTSLLSTSKDTRFMDAGITAAVSAATVVYTATRPGNQSIGFSLFWLLLGSLMFVEGNGELQYLGAGTMAAQSAYLSLRLWQMVKVPPAVSVTQIPGTGSGG